MWFGVAENGWMRGRSDRQLAMLTTVSTEDLIPAEHPIRRIRAVVDVVLAELDESFDAMYSAKGRPSVPPESLLKASVLMALYSIRSERAFCERLNFDLLFKWFLDLRIDEPAFDATTFSKNRQRLLEHEVAGRFFARVVAQARLRRYLSSDHFSVDGPCWKRGRPTRASNRKSGHPMSRRRGRDETRRRTSTARNGRMRPTRRRRTPSRGCSARARPPPRSCVSWAICSWSTATG